MIFIQCGPTRRELKCYCEHTVNLTVVLEDSDEPEGLLADYTNNHTGSSKVLGCRLLNHKCNENGVHGVSGCSMSVCLRKNLTITLYNGRKLITVYWNCFGCQHRNCVLIFRDKKFELSDGSYMFREYYLDSDRERFECHCQNITTVSDVPFNHDSNLRGDGKLKTIDTTLGAIRAHVEPNDYALVKWSCHRCMLPCLMVLHHYGGNPAIDVRGKPHLW